MQSVTWLRAGYSIDYPVDVARLQVERAVPVRVNAPVGYRAFPETLAGSYPRTAELTQRMNQAHRDVAETAGPQNTMQRSINSQEYTEIPSNDQPEDPSSVASGVRFSLPHMRLPKANKVAFSSEDLFKQQRDLTTFDYGLQAVLDTLCVAVNMLVNQTAAGAPAVVFALGEMRFIVNFSGAAAVTSKRFSVHMHHPPIGQFELVQLLGENMTSSWNLVVSDRIYRLNRTVGDIIVPQPVETNETLIHDDLANREPRVIDFEL